MRVAGGYHDDVPAGSRSRSAPGEELDSSAIVCDAVEAPHVVPRGLAATGPRLVPTALRRFLGCRLLAGVRNAPALKDLLAASSGQTALVPVVHKGTKEEASAARETYGSVVTSPTRARSLVWAIEDASGS